MKPQAYYRMMLLLIPVFFSSCFSKYFLSNKDIQQYFAAHPPLPEQVDVPTLYGNLHVAKLNSQDSTASTLLLIHGAPGAWYVYRRMMSDTAINQHYKVLVPDRPGYRGSRKRGRSFGIAEQAEMMAVLLKTEGKQKAIVLGRSYGAPVAMALAAMHPELVKGLILISPASDPDHEKYWWFTRLLPIPPFRWILNKPLRMAAIEKIHHRKELRSILPLWQKVTCKTIIANGGKDWIVNSANAHFTDSALTSAPHQLIFLENSGHLITEERPELVKQWIAACDSSRRK